jgi:5-methyltetrahydropteroyltriglutamate--homocysteine methyltransferase
MVIPTEPIGSIPRPKPLIEGMQAFSEGRLSSNDLAALSEAAVRDTIRLFEETGSPVISDGEQSKPSFATYPIASLDILAPGGVTIPFADGHTRQLPKLAKGPFRYAAYAEEYLKTAKKYSRQPVKQAVISASALSLLYPQEGVPGYPREAFIDDLLKEHEADIRRCLKAGAHSVQIDFTEARLSLKLDASGGLLKSFVALNNRVLERFSAEERKMIGVHTCPGGDRDSTHSADVDYADLLPQLFELKAGRFFIALSAEKDRKKVLKTIKRHAKPDQFIFVGVIDPINPRVETAEEVRDRVLEAVEHIPLSRLGTTDDCGFSPFCDDASTSRETAFAKIRARVAGTKLAEKALGA